MSSKIIVLVVFTVVSLSLHGPLCNGIPASTKKPLPLILLKDTIIRKVQHSLGTGNSDELQEKPSLESNYSRTLEIDGDINRLNQLSPADPTHVDHPDHQYGQDDQHPHYPHATHNKVALIPYHIDTGDNVEDHHADGHGHGGASSETHSPDYNVDPDAMTSIELDLARGHDHDRYHERAKSAIKSIVKTLIDDFARNAETDRLHSPDGTTHTQLDASAGHDVDADMTTPSHSDELEAFQTGGNEHHHEPESAESEPEPEPFKLIPLHESTSAMVIHTPYKNRKKHHPNQHSKNQHTQTHNHNHLKSHPHQGQLKAPPLHHLHENHQSQAESESESNEFETGERWVDYYDLHDYLGDYAHEELHNMKKNHGHKQNKHYQKQHQSHHYDGQSHHSRNEEHEPRPNSAKKNAQLQKSLQQLKKQQQQIRHMKY